MKDALTFVLVICFGLACAPSKAAAQMATVRRVAVLGGAGNTEVEITASEPIVPATQVITGPDRLVLDFPGSVPAATLRNIAVGRADVKSIRVGLFSSKPPVTRVVVDLNAPHGYQVYPSGRAILVKLTSAQPQPNSAIRPIGASGTTGIATPMGASSTVAASASMDSSIGFVTGATVKPIPAPDQSVLVANLARQMAAVPASAPGAVSGPHLTVKFQSGKLSISSEKTPLSQVLFEVQRQTGADIPIPAGAEQEQVVTELGPGIPRDVLGELLNGSPYDFVLVGKDGDPNQLRSVILTRRGDPIPEAQPAPESMEQVAAVPEAPPAQPQVEFPQVPTPEQLPQVQSDALLPEPPPPPQ